MVTYYCSLCMVEWFSLSLKENGIECKEAKRAESNVVRFFDNDGNHHCPPVYIEIERLGSKEQINHTKKAIEYYIKCINRLVKNPIVFDEAKIKSLGKNDSCQCKTTSSK